MAKITKEKELCKQRAIRHYPVALRFDLKALAAANQMTLEGLEIKILKYGSRNIKAILEEDKK